MTADPSLVIAWLVLAHLTADFVLQTERMAVDKFGGGPKAWSALMAHVAVVGATLVPVVAVFGLPGVLFLAVTVLSHLLIDRTKIVLSRRAEAAALRAARNADAPDAPVATLGAAWTPIPGALFIADQLAHMVVLFVAWLVLLSGASPMDWGEGVTRRLVGSLDEATFHQLVLTALVVVDLLIVNVRAGALFVATLVEPQEAVVGGADHDPTTEDQRLAREGMASPAKLGATIGILERLVVVALVLAGQAAAIGLVIAAKTLARFKQLDDRRFAEYYLLGTLASVAVALISGLIAVAVLGPILRR
ncbi:MAG: DUF3307 domain-containing protein [Chloroflexi bacterium]|nr:DUF3307 domain-containing protein [Chloroflexota bacterium]